MYAFTTETPVMPGFLVLKHFHAIIIKWIPVSRLVFDESKRDAGMTEVLRYLLYNFLNIICRCIACVVSAQVKCGLPVYHFVIVDVIDFRS